MTALTLDLLQRMDAYWRAANYLSVGQIYLYDNPLLRRPLVLAGVKRMLLGHWGTTPGQNFVYVREDLQSGQATEVPVNACCIAVRERDGKGI